MSRGESANVATTRRFIDAFNRLDMDAVLADADPDVVLKEWDEAPDSRTHQGRDAVRAAVNTWLETWEWMQVEINELEEVGDRVLVTLHQRAKGINSGIEVDFTTYNVYTFRNGKVTRLELGLTPDYDKEKA